MSIESKSKELKVLVSRFESQWFLGDLFDLMHAGPERAPDQLGSLSSPMRQLYYLAGLNITSPVRGEEYTHYSKEEWNEMVRLLNEVESEYDKVFNEKAVELAIKGNHQMVGVSVPSFLSYFNQGPLNYEEQEIHWIKAVFTPFDDQIKDAFGFRLSELITMYNRLDKLVNTNLTAHFGQHELLRANWEQYTKVKQGVREGTPAEIAALMEPKKPFFYMMSDKAITHRFFADELISDDLSLETVTSVLNLLACQRTETDFLYYTDNIGNPLYRRPILQLENGMFQICEVKQVIHAMRNFLENFILEQNDAVKGAYNNRKGKVLEDRIVESLKLFFREEEYKVFSSYDLDGNEQDVLVIWRKYALIIEAKAINLREPFRDPNLAYKRIKDDFKRSLQAAYDQAVRVKMKFKENGMFSIRDENGLNVEINAPEVEECFIILVTLNSFGPIQNDLSYLLQLDEQDSEYPWAVKMDDLEVFLLTMIKRESRVKDLINFLRFRQTLHGRIFCSDELEVCGGFITRKLNPKTTKNQMIFGHPSLAFVFDEQYESGMGFKDEKLLEEKLSGRFIFL